MRNWARLAAISGFLWVAVLPVSAEKAAVATDVSSEASTPRAAVLDYQGEEELKALAEKGRTVVFFFANWCPNCRATVAELNARWAEVNPELTLIIADYDKETALKSRYGVTYQDTFVLLDAEAQAVKTWNGGGVDGLNANSEL